MWALPRPGPITDKVVLSCHMARPGAGFGLHELQLGGSVPWPGAWGAQCGVEVEVGGDRSVCPRVFRWVAKAWGNVLSFLTWATCGGFIDCVTLLCVIFPRTFP